jgi:predicted Zn-dependent protease
MLFDLRRRGRRRTVQAVYGGLALLMIVGLVGVGVGAGNGNGGILNAFTGGGGGGGAQQSAVSSQEKAAQKAVKASPNSAAAWGQLLQAQWTSAGQGSNYNSSTGSFTAAGKKELAGAVNSWTHYVALTKSPDPSIAVLASRAYAGLGNFSGAASAWEAETQVAPDQPKGFECLAVSAYAAGQKRKGDLATTKALSLLPKAQQTTVKPELASAKTSASTAKQIAQGC